MVIGSETLSEARATVFDTIITDSKKDTMFSLLHKEIRQSVVEMVENLVLNGNPFPLTYPKAIPTIGAMHELCRLLGLQHSLDTKSTFSCCNVLASKKELFTVLHELKEYMGVRGKAFQQSKTSLSDLEVLIAKIRAIFRTWNKARIHSNIQRGRGADRGKRFYTYRLEIHDEFTKNVQSLIGNDIENETIFLEDEE